MTKIRYDFDPFGPDYADVDGKIKNKAEVIDDLKDYIKTRVLEDVGDGLSPVYGRKWKGLSDDYKKIKKKLSSSTKANLELMGDLLDSVTVEEVGKKLRITVGDDQMDKADGHNQFSGKHDFLPKRRFIPNAKDGERFRKEIRDGIKELVLSVAEIDEK